MRSQRFASFVGLAVIGLTPLAVQACPFCTTVSMTFCEEIGQADVAVIAKLVKLPPQSADPSQNAAATVTPARFEIVEFLKGEEWVGRKKSFETLYFGSEPVGKEFLVIAINEKPKLAWATPIAITPPVVPYLKTALSLPKEGPDRLVFFQDHLEGGNEMLARDAYDEFAKAPYQDVVGLKDRMKHDQLIEWIKDPKVTASHRRLYLTMLGVCGNEQDVAVLETMLKDTSPTGKPGMDALVAAYLTLKGPEGMKLVEDLFLKNGDAEYTETYATIMALRFHGQEEKVIPKERLIEGLRHMLDRPQLADLVIPDLARWEDWGSMGKLVQLFKDADDDSNWVRVPVVNYLRACPLPEAKTHLADLEKIDPESVKRANSFFPLGGGAPAASKQPANDGQSSDGAASGVTAEPSADDIPDASKFPDTKERAAVEVRKPEAAKAAPAQAMASRVGAAAAMLTPNEAMNRAAVSTRGILGGVALAGVTLFALMIVVIRGGQHTAAL